MKKLWMSVACSALLLVQAEAAETAMDKAKAMVTEIVNGNNASAKRDKEQHFDTFMDSQAPRATMVYCSDSRVQTINFTQSPENDVFVVRNIGNQLPTAKGSVDYGVEHLNTPVLIFIGHSDCGAIKVASSDYSNLPAHIKEELDTLNMPKGEALNKGIALNVNNQVDRAMKMFGQRVKDGKLVILGAIYDFRDDFKHGVGKLVFINVNGEKDCDKLAKDSILAGIPDVHIGVSCEKPAS
jgi:carbonic anhydrase